MLAGLGVALAVAGLLLPMPVSGVTVAGVALVVVGALQTVAAQRHNRQLNVQEEHLDLDGRREEAESRADQVAALLADLPVPPERLESPDPSLVADVTALQEALRVHRRRVATVREQKETLNEAERDIRSLADACGMESDDESPVAELVEEMSHGLDRAEERHRKAEEAKSVLPTLRDEVESLVERRRSLTARADALTERLEALGEGSADAGCDRLAERRSAARRADAARDRLHAEYPDWKDRREEIETLQAEEPSPETTDADDAEGETWVLSDEERARAEQRLDAVADELREAERARTAREKDAEHLQEQPTVGEIESELAYVEQRLDDVAQKRDRRMLLAGIVGRADAEFRRKHQPDVIRRASEYLTTITQGRYERLALEDGALVIYEQDAAFPRPVGHPLSRGTLDQVYLAIRLAIIDHLDADRQRLPVFLDEVFVNWDRSRREAAFRILADMAANRQLFFFTCHPFFAEEIESHLDAISIKLDR